MKPENMPLIKAGTPLNAQNGIKVVRTSRISDVGISKMHELHQAYFANSNYKSFCADFAEKEWVIIATDTESQLLGFSTIKQIDLSFNGEPVVFMFSGDTIIAPTAWQKNVLAPAIGLFQAKLIEESAGKKCFWFLMSKGYRTYRSLPTFFYRFYPNFSTPMPVREAALLSLIARYKYGDFYNPDTNIISFDTPRDFLCDSLQKIAPGKEIDMHVQFFHAKNPGFARGDELACLAELSTDNFNRTALRVIEAGKKMVEWVP